MKISILSTLCLVAVCGVVVDAAPTRVGGVRGASKGPETPRRLKQNNKNMGGGGGGGGNNNNRPANDNEGEASGVSNGYNFDERHQCITPEKALEYVGAFGHIDKGDTACVEDPVNGCGGGCCRAAQWFVCDSDGFSAPTIPCVCNSLTRDPASWIVATDPPVATMPPVMTNMTTKPDDVPPVDPVVPGPPVDTVPMTNNTDVTEMNEFDGTMEEGGEDDMDVVDTEIQPELLAERTGDVFDGE